MDLGCGIIVLREPYAPIGNPVSTPKLLALGRVLCVVGIEHDPEVTEHPPSIVSEEHIVRLDIAVEVALLVQQSHRLHHSAQVPEDLDRFAVVARPVLFERSSRKVLHYEPCRHVTLVAREKPNQMEVRALLHRLDLGLDPRAPQPWDLDRGEHVAA